MGVSVVIPAYNEERNLPACLKKVYSVLQDHPELDWEIIVVNDGSADKTGTIARAASKKIPHLQVVENRPNRGYGGSLKAGFAAATREFIVMTHADNQLDFSELDKFLDAQRRTGADIVSGVRGGGGDSFYRAFLRWGWNTLVRALFGYLASDIDCGFKLFRQRILDRVSLPSDGAMIDTQLLAGARARSLKVVEVPIRHYPRTAGVATGENPRVIIQAARELAVFWWQLKQEIWVEQGRAVFRWEAILMVVILAIAAFMRLYHIDQYLTFLGDEGRDVLVVRDMLLGRKFTLIGPGTSIGNMYLGPLYYYLLLIPLWLFNFSPVGPAVMVALLGVATVFLLWWIMRQWTDRSAALAASVLYAISPTVVNYSRSSWNPNVMPFFALITMYGVWKVWRLGYFRWLIITAVAYAFVLQSHYLGLLLAPMILVFTVVAYRKLAGDEPARRVAWRHGLTALVIFALLMSPLLWFDLRHNWRNSQSIWTFFTNRQTTVNLKAYKALPNLWPLWVDVNATLLTANNQRLGQLAAVAVLAGAVWITTRKKNQPDWWFVLAWTGFGLVGLGLYKQHIYAHYYGFMFPVPFLILGFVVSQLKRTRIGKLVVGATLLGLVVVNGQASPMRFLPNRQLAHTQQVADFIISEAKGRPFNLALIAKRNYDKSYVYFLRLNAAPYYTIHEHLADQLFVICEDPVCEPIGHPLWEIAAFGWAKIDRLWEFPWGVKLFKLVPNPDGKPQ